MSGCLPGYRPISRAGWAVDLDSASGIDELPDHGCDAGNAVDLCLASGSGEDDHAGGVRCADGDIPGDGGAEVFVYDLCDQCSAAAGSGAEFAVAGGMAAVRGGSKGM